MTFTKEILKGLFKENPIFRLMLGMCPTLAVTTSVENAIGMGAAATFVLVCSNAVISSIRKIVPSMVRIPCYIVVIAGFVTMVEMLMKAFSPALYESLGIFIPLIVVNCIILGRAEAFASKNTPLMSIADGLGMGIGFLFSLSLIAAIREFVGEGSITIWTTANGVIGLSHIHSYKTLLAILPPGGFLTLGLLLAAINASRNAVARARGLPPPIPPTPGCRGCMLCDFSKHNSK